MTTTHDRTMRIGQLAGRLGLNTRTVRYYESIGLLPEPERTAGGYRLYGEYDLQRLTFIRTAQRLGLTLDDIGEILAFRERGQTPCGHVVELLQRHARELDQRIAELRELRDELDELVARAGKLPDGAGAYCGLIEHRATDDA
ncbi:MAG: heavy metal-responsive transcriptional regulator [Actinobacteria bacterium]|nr:heavy metal-responsive transcriptional regulator [Actinomycetota bacterium]